MNANEKRCHDLLVRNGYRVLRRGWPDFLAVTPDLSRGFAIELKVGADRLSEDQITMHSVLGRLGLLVHVWREAEMDKFKRSHLHGRAFLTQANIRKAQDRVAELEREVASLRSTIEACTVALSTAEEIEQARELESMRAAMERIPQYETRTP